MEKRKRLLIFHPTIAPYRIDLFNELYRAFDVRVCLLRRGLLSQKFDYEKISQQLVFSPTYAEGKGKWAMVKFFVRNIREFKPDVVMAHEYGMSVVAAILYRWLTRARYRVVTMCDDSYDMVVNDNDFSRGHKMARRVLAPLVDDMVLVEPNVCDWYQKNYGKGICFPIIRREETIRETYQQALGISRALVVRHELQGKKVFLFVGRLVRLKNVHTLIRAFHKASLLDARLVVVGDGTERAALEQLAHDLGEDVIFTGRLEGLTLYAWYNVADCFVLPSTQEAFGAVTNEALVAGCKCLVSKLAGSQCLIENEKNGYTFDPHDEDELKERIQKMAGIIVAHGLDVLRKSEMACGYEELMGKLVHSIDSL